MYIIGSFEIAHFLFFIPNKSTIRNLLTWNFVSWQIRFTIR